MNLQTHIKTELWLAVQNSYSAENYKHAILDAFHYMSDIIREKSGIDGDGQKLIGNVFGGKSPLINAL